MRFEWPPDFRRVPSDEWTTQPLESLALKYDTVENHGWYENLEPTIEQVLASLSDGDIVVDYSGGTGIFADRLLRRIGDSCIGIVIVDASAKFLRLALEKLRHDERVGFRLIRYLRPRKRLEFVDEVLPRSLLGRGMDALVSTNAIHLYYDLPDTLRSWVRILRAGARVFIQSGNIRNPNARPGEWIIDETIEAIHRTAVEIVARESRWVGYRDVLRDPGMMKVYGDLRHKYFLPVRDLEYYLGALGESGFTVRSVSNATIPAPVNEWYDFVSIYHEGVLGWVGGAEKLEGRAPSDEAIRDRLDLLRIAMDRVFGGRRTFDCCWTYIECETAIPPKS